MDTSEKDVRAWVRDEVHNYVQRVEKAVNSRDWSDSKMSSAAVITVALVILCIVSWFFVYNLLKKPDPEPTSKIELCARSCSTAGMQQYVFEKPNWKEEDGSKWGKWHEPTGATCLCNKPKETP